MAKKEKEPRAQVIIKMPLELKKMLEEEAETEKRSMNNQVLWILERYFKGNRTI